MKHRYFYTLLLAGVPLVYSCKKEAKLSPSPDLHIPQLFAPPEDAPAAVKELYSKYNVWVRMDFTDWREVTNGILGQDPNNRWGVGKIEDAYRESALVYTKTLLSNVPDSYVKSFFPLELFYVKSYAASFWAKDIQPIGRSRLVICWPNQMRGALPVTDPALHYYKDSVLTSTIWNYLGGMIQGRMKEAIPGFEKAGKAYDAGTATDRIDQEYNQDGDLEKRNAALDKLAAEGGFIRGSGSKSFEVDFPQWLALLTTNAYEDIKAQYLDNSPARARKYEVIIAYFKKLGWDIQATGNLYSKKHRE